MNSRIVKEIIRTGLLLALAGLLLHLSTYHLPDAALGPVLTTSSVLVFIVAFSHLTRRIVLPSIDLAEFLGEAKKGNLAAAVVAAAVIYAFVALVQAGVALLR